MTPKRLLDGVEVVVGHEIRCKPVEDGGRRDWTDHAIGGIVCEVVPGLAYLDDEGERRERPERYVVYDPEAPKGHEWHELDADEVDPASMKPSGLLATAVRHFAYVLGDTSHWRRRRLAPKERDLVRYIAALGKAEMARGAPTPVRLDRKEEENWG